MTTSDPNLAILGGGSNFILIMRDTRCFSQFATSATATKNWLPFHLNCIHSMHE